MRGFMQKELIIVTGAGSGIGRATALAFHRLGHALLLIGRDMAAVRALSLPQSLCLDVDVTDGNAFAEAVEQAEAKFGPAGCLVNNAGVMLLGQMDTQSPQEWDRMLRVNVRGVMNGVRSVLGKMRERKEGTVINLSSIAGKKSFPNHTAYAATKFAVHGMTENLREENAQFGVRFITIAPGVVDTGLLNHTTSTEIKDQYGEWKKTLGTILSPSELAEIVLFAYRQPPHVCIRELVVATTAQEA